MIRFGDVTLHEGRREVHRSGEEQHLEPQAFDVLCYLVAHHDRVVSKEELLDEVWGDQFVSESALTTRIKEVRRAVGDDGRTQAVVRNSRGRGYRFVATFEQINHEPLAQRIDVDGHRGQYGFPPRRELVGREAVLQTIADSIMPGSLVTLIGPGGVGKTTLAIEAAYRRPELAIGGFVDLASIADAAAIVPTIRQAVGLTSHDGHDVSRSLAAVAALDALVVMDNCEHLIDDVASVVDQLMTGGGALTVLATSRERLGIPGERAVPIGPMDPDDARALFTDRVHSLDPELRLGTEDAAAVDALLVELDHLPLAIEMAAGRMSSLGLADLGSLVDQRLELLRSADRNVTDRHRTLSELVAWSEELLDPDEQALFVDMSVFAGPVPTDDVVGVLSATDADRLDLLDRLTSLVDKSLVTAMLAARPVKYRMLETVKAHARPRLLEDRNRRHAEWFVRVAETADADLRTARELSGHQRITAAAAELRQAHAWARANDPDLAARLTAALSHHAFSRFWGEPAEWARELADIMSPDLPGAPAVWAALAREATLFSDYGEAERLAKLALAGDDQRAHFWAYDALSDVALYTGDTTSAAESAHHIGALGHSLGDPHGVVMGVVGGSMARTYADDPTAGLAYLEGAVVPPALSPSDQAWLIYAEAEALARTDASTALLLYERVIELAEPMGARYVTDVARVSLAATAARTGDPQALDRFASVLRAFQRGGNVTHAVTTLRNLISLLVAEGHDEAAMRILGALSTDGVKSTYGQEAQQLDRCQAVVAERAGHEQAAAWLADGLGRGVGWAVAYALVHLAGSQR